MKISDITEEFLRSIDVHTVLPQQEPFVMVGTLTKFGMHSTTTETEIDDSHIFVTDGVFSPCGIVENIAQTCAARIGFYNKYILMKDIRIGYIGAIRDYEVSATVRVGDVLVTTINVIEDFFGMTLAAARVTVNDEVIATAQIKLSVKNID